MEARNSKDQEGMPVHRADRHCNRKTAASIGVRKSRGRTNRSSESCATPSTGSSKVRRDKLSIPKQLSSTDKAIEFQNEKLENLCSKLVNLLGQHASQECSSEQGTDSQCSPYTGTEASLGQELQDLQALLSRQVQSLQKQIGNKEKITGRSPSSRPTWKASLSAIWNVCNDLGEFLLEARSRLHDPDYRIASNNNKKVTQVPIAISFNQKKKQSLRQTQGRVDVQQIVNCRAPDKPGIQNSKHSRLPLTNSPKKSIINPGKKMILDPTKDPDCRQEVSEKPNCQQRASEKPKPATIKLQLVSNDHKDEAGVSCKVTEKQSPYAILELPTNAEITIEASMTCDSNSKLKAARENKRRMSPRNRSSKIQNCIGAQHAAHLEQEINRLKEQRQAMEEKLEQSLEGALVPLQSPAWSWCLQTNHLLRNMGDFD